jgi:hypothetical protein
VTEPPRDDSGRNVPPYVAIVRQGRDDVFEFLQHFREANLTEVFWDRRVGDRRADASTEVPDRRTGERRSGTSLTWDTLGFVIAPLTREASDVALIPAPAPARAPSDPEARAYDLCVVRRGHAEVFRLMEEHFKDDPSVRVIWDRRGGERRTTPRPSALDRRRGERRRP